MILENLLGYPLHERTQNGISVLTGTFSCDQPPVLGFSFPAQSQLKPGQKSKYVQLVEPFSGIAMQNDVGLRD